MPKKHSRKSRSLIRCGKWKPARRCWKFVGSWALPSRPLLRWKRKFAGLGVAELCRLRQLEEENQKLKQLVADLTLDTHMLQEVLRKKF